MIRLADKLLCTGCAACATVCTRKAISMQPDAEGFLYPRIDFAQCVGCGLCRKICPVLSALSTRLPISVYAAKAKEDEIRRRSSSGGVFSLLARQILSEDGIVYGAAVRQDDLMIYHRSAVNEDELALLRGSKYVQSEIGDTYSAVKEQLMLGRKVLFSGTPCQVAGLRACLGKVYDNLLCVDVICQAVPSPMVWGKYLEARAVELMGRGSEPTQVFDHRLIFFRRKDCGWRRYALSLGYASDNAYQKSIDQDLFLLGFQAQLYNRPSCHQCAFRELRSGSDLTIADYWGIAEKFPDMDDDSGVSVVLVNTDKGKCVFDGIRNDCEIAKSEFKDIRRCNHSVYESTPANPKRSAFFRMIHNGQGFDSAVLMQLKIPLWRRTLSFCRRQVGKVVG